jgi:hypothetical protein
MPARVRTLLPGPLSFGLALSFGLLLSRPAAAQEAAAPDDERLRIGITLGGTALVGVVGEMQWGDWSAEVLVGTISFRDLSIAVAGKRYFSEGRLRPAAGLGLWSLSIWSEEGNGSALLLRAPLAVDWTISGGHAMGVEVGLNRALWIDRLDPADERGPSSNIVPFPGLYYRYSSEP